MVDADLFIQKDEKKKDESNQLAKSVKDRYAYYVPPIISLCICLTMTHHSNKIAIEAQHGLIAQVLKDVIFSGRPGAAPEINVASVGEAVDTAMSIG